MKRRMLVIIIALLCFTATYALAEKAYCKMGSNTNASGKIDDHPVSIHSTGILPYYPFFIEI